ncbi:MULTISPECIES: hypothetical protein [unclassified Moraxella]|uniref:hypothetical protein n=1 Tax=unclassified Moraxella TaxID=2685852 RepID=UPI003AF58D32
MNADEIYQALKQRGYNATTIAEALDVRPQSVATVIRDGHGSKKIAKAVALAGNYEFEVMFPFYKEKQERKARRTSKITELKNELALGAV